MAETPKARVLAQFPNAVCRKINDPLPGEVASYSVVLHPGEVHAGRCASRPTAALAWVSALDALDVVETRMASIRADAAANPDHVTIIGDDAEPRDLTPLESLANIKADIAAVMEPAPTLPIYYRDEQQKIYDLENRGLREGVDFVIRDWPSHPKPEPARIAIVGPGDGRFAERLDLARMADKMTGHPLVIVDNPPQIRYGIVALDEAMILSPAGVLGRMALDDLPDPDFTKGKPFPKHRDQQRAPQNIAQHAKAKRGMQRASRRANRGR